MLKAIASEADKTLLRPFRVLFGTRLADLRIADLVAAICSFFLWGLLLMFLSLAF